MADSSTHGTNFYAARCMLCFKKTAIPKLPEFAFGEYLYSSADGNVYANFNAFEEMELSEIIDGKLRKFTSEKKLNELTKDKLKHDLIGKLADKPDSVSGFITGKHICPRCGSKYIRVNHEKKLKSQVLPKLQFNNFKSLSPEEKEKLIGDTITTEFN